MPSALPLKSLSLVCLHRNSQMSAYWSNFARSGSPNAPLTKTKQSSLPQWPKYSAEGDTVLRLDVASAGGIKPQQGLRKAACDFQQAQAPLL